MDKEVIVCICVCVSIYLSMASKVTLVVKNNLPANAGDIRDLGLISGSRKPLEKIVATYSSILARESPWTEEPGRL